MKPLPRRTLKRLYDRFGRELVDDPRRTEALLNDLCPAYRREIFVLVNAQRQQVPAEMLAAPRWMPRHALHARLARRLQDKLSLTEDAAFWAVDTWSYALGKSDPSPARSSSFPYRKRALTPAPAQDLDEADHPLTGGDDTASANLDPPPAITESAAPAPRGRARDPRRNSPLRRLLASPLAWVAAISLVALTALTIFDGTLSTASLSSDIPALGYAGVAQPGELLKRIYPLPRYAWVSADTLNIRSGPSMDDDAVHTLANGESVMVDEFSADGAWSHISSPTTGWVFSQYLNYISEADDQTAVQLAVEELAVVSAEATLHTGPGIAFPVADTLPGDTQVIAVASTLDGQWRHLASPVAGWVSSAELTP